MNQITELDGAACARIDAIVRRLREHADRTAGGGPSERNYDPETLDIKHDAANCIEELVTAIKKHRETFPDEPLEGEKHLWGILDA